MSRCLHCATRAISRPRGLCRYCYDSPGMRERYGLIPRIPQSETTPTVTRAPAEPTEALPGTEAKIEALASRIAGGVELWHTKDARRVLS